MTPQPFTREPQIGSLLFVLIDTDRDPSVVATTTDSKHPIPGCIVRSGTVRSISNEREFTKIRRIFP